MNEKLENFERAFSSGSGGCVRICECNKQFYDGHNSYDWEDGEIESLEADKNSVCLDYTVSTIIFEDKEYVVDCSCWHKRAEQIMGFIDGHSHSIAEYLTLEKKRKQSIANNSPTVK